MNLKIYEDSKNYTCQVIKLPTKIVVKGLDNLVEVNYQGNSCLIGKDSNEDELYLFFPAECKISPEFLKANNLFRHSELNQDTTQKGFFEDSGRVKALKLKGVISTGFIIPITSIRIWTELFTGKLPDIQNSVDRFLKVGDEFNEIEGVEICSKYHKPAEKKEGMKNPKTRVIDNIVDSKFAPEHTDTSHLMKNIHKLDLNDTVIISYKLHGTSARYYNTVVKRTLTWKDMVAKFFGVKVKEEEYNYISASRRVVKSVGFEALPDKVHFFQSGDLWSEVGKEYFDGNLNQGEAVYCEIIGKTYTGEAIQHGYSYGYEKPEVFVYRISNINPQGIEIDLPYEQMKQRATQLNLSICPEFFVGKLSDFCNLYSVDSTSTFEQNLNKIFYDRLLEKPSILDSSIIEEGYCLRVDKYGKPDIYKIKSKAFLLHEGHSLDKEVKDLEEEQSI